MPRLKRSCFLRQVSCLRDLEDLNLPSILQSIDFTSFEGKGSSESNDLDGTTATAVNKISKDAIKTLFVYLMAYPNLLGLRGVSVFSEMHRSTVSNHSAKFWKLGLTERYVKPGTEKKEKPTILYRLKDSVDREHILDLYQSRLKEDRNLGIKDELLGFEEKTNSQELHPQTNLSPDPIPTTAPSKTDLEPVNENFVSKISQMFSAMAEEIAKLKTQVSNLDNELKQYQQSSQNPDFIKAEHRIRELTKAG